MTFGAGPRVSLGSRVYLAVELIFMLSHSPASVLGFQ